MLAGVAAEFGVIMLLYLKQAVQGTAALHVRGADSVLADTTVNTKVRRDFPTTAKA